MWVSQNVSDASWQPRARNGRAILLRGASIDEQIGQQILRAWHHRIAREIDDALGSEHLLVDVEIAGVLAAVAVQDDVCGIGEDLRRATAVGIDAGDHRQCGGVNDRSRPEPVHRDAVGDAEGNLKPDMPLWKHMSGGFKGAIQDLDKLGPDAFKDHAMDNYIHYIRQSIK